MSKIFPLSPLAGDQVRKNFAAIYDQTQFDPLYAFGRSARDSSYSLGPAGSWPLCGTEIVDILAMWLKAFGSPVFFWLHVPGGGLFAIIFGYVSLGALKEMWLVPRRSRVPGGA